VKQDRRINLKALSDRLGTGRLSFGSADRLLENLGIRPGAVSSLSMITGVKNGVELYVHPLVNDRTLEISVDGIDVFFNKIVVKPTWVFL
jgi:Ala-tRNA(Pro) deacylase